ncbi:MAG: phosphonate C-P lyase system protein PhnG [Anaerolineae bacterium]|nr:phosphonate C-P lyase system protein PhnG [Candidatus Roseilinea sp.]MDW8450606.1 phosphonate C-P lyase system protein PhnG [Anaerolineae bacterium]
MSVLSAHLLSVLSRMPARDVVALADDVLASLRDVRVIQNRTGIVMLPYRDSAKGVTFHLGEVLMAEAHVRITLPAGRQVEGYGACLGRDVRHALAIAVLDAALRGGVQVERIEAFVTAQAAALDAQDAALLAKVEATRVVMETF